MRSRPRTVLGRILLPFFILAAASPAMVFATASRATGSVPARPEGEKPEGRLVVEKVLIKGAGKEGVEVEVHYRLIDVVTLPGHPSKTTLIMDEGSSRGMLLQKLQGLAAPVSEKEAETTPAAILTFWDPEGHIKPGQPVTVAVAGLVHKHVIPEAGPGYSEDVLTKKREETEAAERERVPPGATLKVLEAKLTGAGGLLQVRFQTTGIKVLSADAKYTYVLDPETGERFDVLRVPRLGLMAPKHLAEYEAGSYMVVRAPQGKIKAGQRITVVVEGLRQEDVIVE